MKCLLSYKEQFKMLLSYFYWETAEILHFKRTGKFRKRTLYYSFIKIDWDFTDMEKWLDSANIKQEDKNFIIKISKEFKKKENLD